MCYFKNWWNRENLYPIFTSKSVIFFFPKSALQSMQCTVPPSLWGRHFLEMPRALGLPVSHWQGHTPFPCILSVILDKKKSKKYCTTLPCYPLNQRNWELHKENTEISLNIEICALHEQFNWSFAKEQREYAVENILKSFSSIHSLRQVVKKRIF